VAFATDFINAQAREGWAAEAEARRAEEAAEDAVPGSTAREQRARRAARDRRHKVSFWDQDIEEGLVALAEEEEAGVGAGAAGGEGAGPESFAVGAGVGGEGEGAGAALALTQEPPPSCVGALLQVSR
jgi:hypothetical protein